MDYIDILEGKFYQTYSGKYFLELPSAVLPKAVGGKDVYKTENFKMFDYEYIDATSWHYKQLLSNLVDTEGRKTVIKTKEPLDFKVGSFVILQDGKMYTVREVTEDMSEVNRENARIMLMPRGISHILYLVERENPWGIR